MDMEIFGREKHTLLSCQGSVCVCVWADAELKCRATKNTAGTPLTRWNFN